MSTSNWGTVRTPGKQDMQPWFVSSTLCFNGTCCYTHPWLVWLTCCHRQQCKFSFSVRSRACTPLPVRQTIPYQSQRGQCFARNQQFCTPQKLGCIYQVPPPPREFFEFRVYFFETDTGHPHSVGQKGSFQSVIMGVLF